jgi:hypothetical protein
MRGTQTAILVVSTALVAAVALSSVLSKNHAGPTALMMVDRQRQGRVSQALAHTYSDVVREKAPVAGRCR